ncbi:MAG: TIGR03987 family protein [Bacteroidetes bacterium]|nr:TIGR03987 family protein [Bacteroidota bacterium]MBT3802039.1 TIGR03987 family protein [Bacteroidota bacterium]MBT4337711.1 TIGR03987 family protein [Bacteroidota bacterium]MBT4728688.1 TIGR03987 family protein [Bacteroidota bacterium]MBT4970130.1 TIGR03987 family protein [Bacteroidota bacterium]
MIIAVGFINLAFVLYTVGVWAEKIKGQLKWWHAIVFWFGVAADSTGTGAMGVLAGSVFQFNFHGLTGMLAILLMLFHAIWATIVLAKKNEKMILKFHKYSLFVWIIWLIPMITGMVFGTMH